jgi:hypothetical protein
MGLIYLAREGRAGLGNWFRLSVIVPARIFTKIIANFGCGGSKGPSQFASKDWSSTFVRKSIHVNQLHRLDARECGNGGT